MELPAYLRFRFLMRADKLKFVPAKRKELGMFVSTSRILGAKKGTSPVRSRLSFTHAPLSSHCLVGIFGECWDFKEIFLSRKISNIIQNQRVYPRSANHSLFSLSIQVLSFFICNNQTSPFKLDDLQQISDTSFRW